MENRYNIHTHIFTGNCAPKDFLQVGLKLGDGFSSFLKWLFLTKPVSWLIEKLGSVLPNKTLQFLKIGVMGSQTEVFGYLRNAYSQSAYSDIKFIALTIDMDYMTEPKRRPNTDFNAQIQEVLKIKKTWPNDVFPFYGIDPRNPDTLSLSRVKTALESGAFSGIKLYPPNGFFPFDPRLEAVYQYAQTHKIPIMTHCTRGGSYYIGKDVWPLIPSNPQSFNPNHPIMTKINARIAAYKKASNKDYQKNERACNLFTHPENYLPVLDKFPNLKLCIAHMGGDIEILGPQNRNRKHAQWSNEAMLLEGNSRTWYEIIKQDILANYTRTYTDISYSLCDADCMKILAQDLQNQTIDPNRVLFGTDYFMVTKEDAELKVTETAHKALSNHLSNLMSQNNERYLFG